MLPLKILKKQAACNVLNACVKRGKDGIQQPIPAVNLSSCHEGDNNSGSGTVHAVASYWRQRFEAEGVPEPVESIEHIIAHVIGSNKETELHDMEFDELQLAKLKLLCRNRLTKMPLEYVTGEGNFKDTAFSLAPPVFIPEPQTEVLVDILLKHVARSSAERCSVLDVGCGSGAICLSLVRACDGVDIIAIDTNPMACAWTLHNAQNLGLESRLTILHATLEEDGKIRMSENHSTDRTVNCNERSFDFIVSNPPSTPVSEIPKWQKKFEDFQARCGGEDGLKVIKPLLLYASNNLKKDGVLLIEVFHTQSSKIRSIIKKDYAVTLQFNHTYKDLDNSKRIVEISKII